MILRQSAEWMIRGASRWSASALKRYKKSPRKMLLFTVILSQGTKRHLSPRWCEPQTVYSKGGPRVNYDNIVFSYNKADRAFAIFCISSTSFFDFSMYTAGGVGLPDPPAKLAE